MIDSSFSFPLHFRASSWVMGFAAITGEELQWWKTTSPFGPPFCGKKAFSVCDEERDPFSSLSSLSPFSGFIGGFQISVVPRQTARMMMMKEGEAKESS